MEAAIGYQKIAPRPKIPPPIRACPNRGDDFLPNKFTAIRGIQFRLHAGKPTMEGRFGIRRSVLVSNFATTWTSHLGKRAKSLRGHARTLPLDFKNRSIPICSDLCDRV